MLGGGIRDGARAFVPGGGEGSLAYSIVYQTEMVLLIATLILLRPLIRTAVASGQSTNSAKIGLSEFPT
jgi:hypothetical protein